MVKHCINTHFLTRTRSVTSPKCVVLGFQRREASHLVRTAILVVEPCVDCVSNLSPVKEVMMSEQNNCYIPLCVLVVYFSSHFMVKKILAAGKGHQRPSGVYKVRGGGHLLRHFVSILHVVSPSCRHYESIETIYHNHYRLVPTYPRHHEGEFIS